MTDAKFYRKRLLREQQVSNIICGLLRDVAQNLDEVTEHRELAHEFLNSEEFSDSGMLELVADCRRGLDARIYAIGRLIAEAMADITTYK